MGGKSVTTTKLNNNLLLTNLPSRIRQFAMEKPLFCKKRDNIATLKEAMAMAFGDKIAHTSSSSSITHSLGREPMSTFEPHIPSLSNEKDCFVHVSFLSQ